MSRRWRAAALVLTLAATGCTHGPPPSGRSFDDAGCQVGCDRCPPDARCVSSPYRAVCLPSCDGDGDCAVGERCVVVAQGRSGPTVCVRPGGLAVCDPRPCGAVARCRDASTLLRPLGPDDGVCGWTAVRCVSGCDPVAAQCK